MSEPVDKIDVTREGTKAVVGLTLYVPLVGKRTMCFPFECGSEVQAGFLVSALQRMLMEALTDIRRHAYLTGYKAGRAKSAKDTWFSGRL